jgi:CubicO group peptidase (beta-lactamase class C family)
LPATPAQVASYIATLTLEGTPGDKNNVKYNNTGYFMLSQVVAKLRGTATFEDAVASALLKPLSINRIRGSRSLLASQAADEARYHLANIRKMDDKDNLGSLAYGSSIRSSDRPIVPWQYGVDDYEMFDGSGGLSAAVTDLARVVAAFSLRSNNPMLSAASLDALFTNAATATSTLKGDDAHGYHGLDWAVVSDAANHVYVGAKGGWMPSNQSSIIITTGGLSYIIAINGNSQNDTDWYNGVKAAAEAHNWGTTDLFPQFGMPAFAATPVKIPIPPIKLRVEPHNLVKIQRQSMEVGRVRGK